MQKVFQFYYYPSINPDTDSWPFKRTYDSLIKAVAAALHINNEDWRSVMTEESGARWLLW